MGDDDETNERPVDGSVHFGTSPFWGGFWFLLIIVGIVMLFRGCGSDNFVYTA